MVLNARSPVYPNDSQIIVTCAEVLKYTVKFGMPEKNKKKRKVMTPNFFVHGIIVPI